MGFMDSFNDTFNPGDGNSMDWNKIDWNKIDQERFLPKVGQKQTIPDAERLELACKESEDGVHGVVVEVYSVVDGPLKDKVIDVLPVFRWPDNVDINPQEFKDWLSAQDEPTGLKSTIDSCFNLYGEISGVLYRYEEFYAKHHNGTSDGLESDERGSKYIAEYNRWMYKSVEACKKACYEFLEHKYGKDILQEETNEVPKKVLTREDVNSMIQDFFIKENEKEIENAGILKESFQDKAIAEEAFNSYTGSSNDKDDVIQNEASDTLENSDNNQGINGNDVVLNDIVTSQHSENVNNNQNNLESHNNLTYSLGNGFVESFEETEAKPYLRPTIQAVPKSEKLEQEFSGFSKKSDTFHNKIKSETISTNQNEELLSFSDNAKIKRTKDKDKSKNEPFRIWVRPEGFQKGYSGILVSLENNMYAYIPDENCKILNNSEKFKNWAIVFAKDKDFSFTVCNEEKTPTDFKISIASLRKQLDKQLLKNRLATHKNFQKDHSTEVGER